MQKSRYTGERILYTLEECVITDYFNPSMDPRAIGAVSALGLAHVGDAVFELLVRTWLCTGGKVTSQKLHQATIQYVSAPAQAEAVARLLPHLQEEEAALFRRGRNAHVNTIPKHATHEQYAKATGLETLFGALYLAGQIDRLNELFAIVVEEDHAL